MTELGCAVKLGSSAVWLLSIVPGCVSELWKILNTAMPPPRSLSCVKNRFWYGEAEAPPQQSQSDSG
jgi:hypothetical protein